MAKKSIVLLLGLLLAVAVLVLTLIYMQRQQLPEAWLNDEKYLRHDQVALLIQRLRSGEYRDDSLLTPLKIEVLVSQLFTEIDRAVQDKMLKEHLFLASQLLRETQLAAFKYRKLSSLKLSPESLDKFILNYKLWIKLSVKEGGLTELQRQMMLDFLMPLSLLSEDVVLSDQNLQKIYKALEKQKLENSKMRAEVLKVLWLARQSPGFSRSQDYIYDLSDILETQGDLIRSINHHDTTVVILSLGLIKRLQPKNAIHGLRYHLIHSTNEQIKIAVLEAIGEYGVVARPYSSQLKSVLRLSKSDQIKNKIKAVLKQINGL
ncbi:hypothetical protein [Pelagibaculum spongiae]|uniref:Uncharacterized protein n=1 Tax=Pelagibaculum spongiae TaxID=2080658 RepID=A0A2V1GU16_9GAMM|nr:hypothetical protein [Pelagibaculum spongiae]PVZ66761.1 hypothetical protein DC094_15975 [Pelagibaculum spongiae]